MTSRCAGLTAIKLVTPVAAVVAVVTQLGSTDTESSETGVLVPGACWKPANTLQKSLVTKESSVYT